uniref:Uncharacterized protein n=1 Tax=Myoviridae sp. ct2Qy24 TaxID=2827656 RepID=A0A8S5STP0_9CAUD|nr:MAG TPA: hypothetical protein [Myoviridae sp. ct2Qy24]
MNPVSVTSCNASRFPVLGPVGNDLLMHFGGFEDPESQMNSFCNSVHHSTRVRSFPLFPL